MKHYDEFPGYANIQSEEISPGVFKVLEPFTIPFDKWFADDEYRDVICDRLDGDSIDNITICYYEAGVNRISRLKDLLSEARLEHPTASVLVGSFIFSVQLGGLYDVDYV